VPAAVLTVTVPSVIHVVTHDVDLIEIGLASRAHATASIECVHGNYFTRQSASKARDEIIELGCVDARFPVNVHAIVPIGVDQVSNAGNELSDIAGRGALGKGIVIRIIIFDAHEHFLACWPGGDQLR
jgi:hypothetical protein